MRLTRSRKLIVSMGPYEQYHFGAEVSATHHDLGFTDEEMTRHSNLHGLTEELQKLVDEQLDKALVQELEDAADLTADKKSFLLRALK